jgi:hypothetical protein
LPEEKTIHNKSAWFCGIHALHILLLWRCWFVVIQWIKKAHSDSWSIHFASSIFKPILQNIETRLIYKSLQFNSQIACGQHVVQDMDYFVDWNKNQPK